MYVLCKLDKNKELYLFNGSLEDFLIERGVSENHINEMKKKKLEFKRSAYQIYSGEDPSVELVPLDKVIGTSRCTPGWSVFDNVNKMFNGDRMPDRFISCLNFLNNMSLSELRKSYEVLPDPVKMTYYIDDDAYYLEGDGNHRTLIAMLLGAENIRAKVTKTNCDYDKKEKVCKEEEFRKNYGIVEIRKDLYINEYEITFRDDCGHYVISVFEGKKENEGVLDLINRLSNTIDTDKKIIGFLTEYTILCKVILFYIKKKDYKRYLRLKKYIKKEYLKLGQFRPLNNYQKICLYNL